jgi:hypothetical protein
VSGASPDWAAPVPGGCVLTVRVVPRAARDEAGPAAGGALKVRLRAPPLDDRANRALQDFLAATLGVRRTAVALVSGAHSRLKRVRVAGLSPADVAVRVGDGGARVGAG